MAGCGVYDADYYEYADVSPSPFRSLKVPGRGSVPAAQSIGPGPEVTGISVVVRPQVALAARPCLRQEVLLFPLRCLVPVALQVLLRCAQLGHRLVQIGV